MKPIGPLMWEHRLIERMLAVFDRRIELFTSQRQADPLFLDTALDFFRWYVDKSHHVKEEEILFKALGSKHLSVADYRILGELLEEHTVARKLVRDLGEAVVNYEKSNTESLNHVTELSKKIINLYTLHIEKEDKHFFYPVLEYLNEQEQDKMLEDIREFDCKLFREKYEALVEAFES